MGLEKTIVRRPTFKINKQNRHVVSTVKFVECHKGHQPNSRPTIFNRPPQDPPNKQTEAERKQWEIEGVGEVGLVGWYSFFYYLKHISHKIASLQISTFPLLLLLLLPWLPLFRLNRFWVLPEPKASLDWPLSLQIFPSFPFPPLKSQLGPETRRSCVCFALSSSVLHVFCLLLMVEFFVEDFVYLLIISCNKFCRKFMKSGFTHLLLFVWL